MKTAYGKFAILSFIILAGLLLFAPMRSGMDDYLYAYPHSIRMNEGDSYDITYILDSDRAQIITYNSVNENIAQVNQQGRVTAQAPGKTEIRLMAEKGAKALIQVEVVGTPVTTMTLNTQSMSMEKGQVSGLEVTFNEGADDTRVEWVSADKKIALVDAVGRVSAVGGGKTQITASSPSGLVATADVSVHVSGDAIQITPDGLTVGTGANIKLDTYYIPADTTDEINRWLSNDANVLSVKEDGTIHAVGEGTAVLSVFTRDGLGASTVVTVEKAAKNFDIAPSAVTIERGLTLTLEPRFMNEEGQLDEQLSAHYIDWASSNPDVATVKDGLITGISSGTTRITAKADGISATCNVRVQVLVHEVTLEMDEVYLLREQTDAPIQLNPILNPSDPDDATIIYSTNNAQVANVSKDGLVSMTGGYGTAIITAQAQSGAEAHFTLNVVTALPEEPSEDTSAENSTLPETTEATPATN